jgi:BirA family biotin operon repressor/biotin-[acetyl-CoA-carboxylase] ligase
VDSTQAIVFALAADGAPDGTAVVAAHQREGRGRRGRSWTAPPGTALLVSVLVRPLVPPKTVPLYSFVAAVAVADTVERLAGLPARLKWPNDVLVGGAKIAGILLEARTSAPGDIAVAIGIGLNLGQTEFPADLRTPATSIRVASGRDIVPAAALSALQPALAAWRQRFEREGFAPVRERWLALAETLGRRVRVDDMEGVAVDLDDDGALVLEADDGARRRALAGDVVEVRGGDHAARR